MRNAYQLVSGRLSQVSEVALLLARVIIGAIVIDHAVIKFTQQGGDMAFRGFLASLHNVPFPAFTGSVIPWAELVLGGMLILGALTRVAALVLTAEFLIIAFLIKLNDFHAGVVNMATPGAELEFVLIAGLIVLFFCGPGRGSADYFLGLEARRAAAAPKSGNVPSGAIG